MANNLLRTRAQRLKTEIPALALALKDARTPHKAKFFAALSVAYALSPIDLIPDFIPFIGILDDLLIVPALAGLAIKNIPKEVLEDCRKRSQGLKMQQNWRYAIPIIAFYLVLLLLVLKWLKLI